jgi:hypothetical protein
MNLHENLSSGSRVFPCRRTDGQADMTKLIVAFRNFVNATKNHEFTRSVAVVCMGYVARYEVVLSKVESVSNFFHVWYLTRLPFTSPVWPRGGEVVSLTNWLPLPPRNVPGTHYHLGLSRPQDHGAVGRKYVTEKSSDTTGNRSRDRPTSSAAP